MIPFWSERRSDAAATKIASAFEWPGRSARIAPFSWGSAALSNIRFLGPTHFQTKRHLYWFSCFCTSRRRMSHYFTMGRYVPQKIALFPGGSGPPSNTWYPGPTQVIIPNGISNGSVVFAWVPNAVLYNALSIEKKPPKLPLPLVISLPCLGRTEPRPTCVRCHSRLRFCWFWHALAHSSALVTVSS